MICHLGRRSTLWCQWQHRIATWVRHSPPVLVQQQANFFINLTNIQISEIGKPSELRWDRPIEVVGTCHLGRRSTWWWLWQHRIATWVRHSPPVLVQQQANFFINLTNIQISEIGKASELRWDSPGKKVAICHLDCHSTLRCHDHIELQHEWGNHHQY